MTAASVARAFAFVFTLAFALALPSAAQAAGAVEGEWTIDQLMQALSRAKPGRASFVEKKSLSVVDRPIESSGELRYTYPDRLEKITIKPRRERMVVEGNSMSIERGDKKYSMQLQDYPDAAAFIDSIRGTLAGDRKVLERSFALQLRGNEHNWTLLLTPKDAVLGRSVHQVRVTGREAVVRGLEVIQPDGDRSQMTIEPMSAP